jgi:hypothetical protein
MRYKSKNIMFQAIIGLVLIASLSNFSYSALSGNWRECLAAPGCTCSFTLDIAKSATTTLKTYIILSAGYSFDSYAAYQSFLSRVEMADINGIDYKELKSILYSAIEHMEKARASYENVKLIAVKTSYNQDLIDKLMKFDYEGFRSKYGLNEPIFERVKSLLLTGDVPGIDDNVIANMDTILKQLYTARAIVDNDSAPDVSTLWRINQSYFEAQLFGQYLSEILKANL